MIYILQHSVRTQAGSTLEWLQSMGLEYKIVLVPNDKLPSVNETDALIICGGGMNVDQEDKYPWLKAEKKLIRECIESGKKVFGLCLGGQLIAEVLGARVSQHDSWELGWQDVKVESCETLEVPSAGKTLRVFQWHGYSFDTPKGATSIAGNPHCKHQAFIYKSKVIGTQFHPEMTDEMIKSWIQDEQGQLPTGPYCQSEKQIHAETLSSLPPLTRWYHQLLNNWWK